MSAPTPQQVLDLPMDDNDSGADTVRGYLVALLATLWQEGDGFSGKSPFGNSDWTWDVYGALVTAGFANNPFDADGYVTSVNDFDVHGNHPRARQQLHHRRRLRTAIGRYEVRDSECVQRQRRARGGRSPVTGRVEIAVTGTSQ